MKNIFDYIPSCKDDEKAPRIFWFLGLSVVWMLWIIQKANEARAHKAAEVATYRIQFGHGSDATAAHDWVIVGGVLALYVVFFIAHFFAVLHVAIQKSIGEKHQHLQNKREQRAFEGKMQDMDRDNAKQDALSKAAQSKQELIIRLGSVDQYIRVLAIETDVSKRTVALQAAHSEMTTLAAKLASGQISREAVDAPEVREHASETSKDLARLGLTEDRLNRDIIRMFKLTST